MGVEVAWEVTLLFWWVTSQDESRWLVLGLMDLVKKAAVILQPFVFVLCIMQLSNSAYV